MSSRRRSSASALPFLAALLGLAATAACDGASPGLVGAWTASDVSHPSAFFASATADDAPGQAHVVFGDDGRFAWTTADGTTHAGTYAVEDGGVRMTTDDGETTRVVTRIEGDQLTLETDDGFTFVFERG